MSLKYKIKKVKNKHYDQNKKEYDVRVRLLEGLRTIETRSGFTAESFNETIHSEIKRSKDKLKKLDLTKEFKKLTIVADRDWTFYPEFISDQFGITRYSPDAGLRSVPVPVTVKVGGEYALNSSKDSLAEIKAAKNKAIAEIKGYRTAARTIQHIEKEFKVPDMPYASKYKVYVGGGNGLGNNNFTVHMVPGEIMRLKEETKLRKIFSAKKPLTKENHIGVELEFICKKDKFDLAKILYKHGVSDYVHLLDDGSLRAEDDYPFMHEITVLMPESKTGAILKSVIDALNEAGSKVNNRCGLHVHVDCRNRDRSTVFNNFVKAQNMLFAMNPALRKTGKKADGRTDTVFSRPVSEADFDEALINNPNNNRESRYMGINPHAYGKYQTIEVRIHSGSTNFDKIYNWVCILVNIANSPVKHKTEATTVSSFCERFELNSNIEAYMNGRINKFKDKQGNHITIDEAV